MQIFKSFTPEVVTLLKSGAVGVIPTDTIYGVACSLFDQAAVERIYNIKDRPEDKAVGTVLIGDVMQIEQYVKPADLLAAEVYWPAPVSVVLPLGRRFAYAHKGLDSLPFRIPDVAQLQDLLMATGPLATTSANISGRPPATNIEEALSYFRENVDFYVDGSDLSDRKPSRILKLNNGNPEEIRGR